MAANQGSPKKSGKFKNTSKYLRQPKKLPNFFCALICAWGCPDVWFGKIRGGYVTVLCLFLACVCHPFFVLDLNNDTLLVMLGQALTARQLLVTGVSALGFQALANSGRCPEAISRWLGQDYRLLDEAKQLDFRITVTSTAHALIVSALGAWVFFWPEREIWDESSKPSPLFMESPRAMLAFAIATGYFLWDVKHCLTEKKLNVGFTMHACLCFLVYLFGQFPFLNYHGCFFLLFEASTLFLNARKVLLLTGQTKHPLLPVMSQLFAVCFLLVRIIGGMSVSYAFWRAVLKLMQDGVAHSRLICAFYLASNLALNGLNVFWFAQILRSIFKKRA